MKNSQKFRPTHFFLGVFSLIAWEFVDAANIMGNQKYAEDSVGGYVNLGVQQDAQSNEIGGITVSSTQVSGQMWSENLGWIEMQPDTGGVTLSISNGEGVLDGKAWSEQIGWIHFGTWDDDPGSGVYIDGDGYFYGVAWSENYGAVSFGDYMLENSVSTQYTEAADKETYWARTSWRPNVAPTVSNDTINGLEDTTIAFVATNFSDNFSDTDGGSLTKIQITALAANGTLKLSGTDVTGNQEIALADFTNLAFVPNGNWNGTTSFQWKGYDGGLYSESAATMTLEIVAVNDAPSFTLGSAPTVEEDAGAQSYVGWATNISAGPTDESGQILTFNVINNTNAGLFAVAPSIDSSSGNLTFTPAANAFGFADITITLSDDGGVTNGGDDTSAGQAFTITVTEDNDAPVVDDIPNQTITEGASFTTIVLDDYVADVDNPDTAIVWTTSGATDLSVSITDRVATINIPDENWTGSETITFTAKDAEPLSGSDAAIFTVNGVNDAPVLAQNNGLAVNKGATGTVLNSALQTTDVDIDSGDQTASDLVYTLSSVPANGDLKLNTTILIATNTFTQADIDAGNIIYVHDNTETTADSFNFTVTDGTVTLPATGTNAFNITISVDNFTPTLDINTGSTVNEGGIDTISNLELSASDQDVPAQTLTYTITTAPVNGTLRNDGTGLGQGDTFTQTDIDNNNVQYAHDGSETVGDSFDFSIGDGAGGQITGQTFNLTINPINDAPVNTIPGGIINVNEDNDLVINTISVSDDDAGNNDLVVTLSVTKGTILVVADVVGGLAALNIGNNNSVTVTLTGTLTEINTTLADVNAVTYSPNQNVTGNETLTVSLNDQGNSGGGGAQTDSDGITINIVAQNDSPVLANNEGLSVGQGLTGTIVNSTLQVTDPDITSGEQTTSDMVFTLTSIPSNGAIKLNGTTTLAVNDTFTQADIDGEKITYEHDNSETTTDSFNFSTSDGTITLPEATFNISITVDNYVPVIATNAGLTLDEAATANITPSELEATDQDSGQTLTFTVNTAPTNGILRLNTTVLGDGDTFTQVNIGTNNISYEHNGSETASDSFVFSVSDGAGGQIIGQTFDITINPINDAPSFTNISSQGIAIGQVLIVDFATLGNPQDAENNNLNWSINVTNDNVDNDTQWAGSITENPANSGIFEFDPQNTNFDGKIEVTVVLTDDGTPNESSSQTGLIVDWLQNTNPEIRSGLTTTYNADEDNNLTLSLNDTDKSDNEDGPSNLTWSVTGFDNGVVSVDGNTITFVPDQNYNGTDQVTLVLTDSNNGTDSLNLDLTWTAVNDAPVNVVPASRTVDEDTELVVSGISVNDVDAAEGSIQIQFTATSGVITVKTDVSGGITVEDVSNNGTSHVGAVGTITALNNTLSDTNGIIYRGNRDFNGTDILTIGTDDQGNTGSGGAQTDLDDITLNITAVNDVPVVSGIPDQEVAEGNIFTAISLDDYVADPDNTDSEISWFVSGNTDLSVDITNRVATISVPNENWTGTETIIFTGEDDEPLSGSDDANFTITPVNDAPVLENNTGITVTQGESVTILNSNLSIEDVDLTSGDQVVTDIVYTVVNNVPTNGELRLNGSTVLVANDTFTQNDINEGAVAYVHDGSETETDSFGFIVSDGTDSIPTTGNYIFNISVTIENYKPVLDINDGLTLEEAATATITTSQLSASDIDEPAQTLTYTVNTTVQNGTLRLNTIVLEDGDTFTQADIENNNIIYEHNGTETSSDNFEFSIDDGNGGQVLNQIFNITINNVNDAPTISVIANQTIQEDTDTGIINFTISDEETALEDLVVTKSSSNTDLVPNINIGIGGTRGNRTIRVFPLEGQYGTVDITLIVSDGDKTAQTFFTLTVLEKPVFWIPNEFVVEENAEVLTVGVNLSGQSKNEIKVDYTTSDGTAKAGENYVTTSGTLVWAERETGTKYFSIIIIDNETEELNKDFKITISNPVEADIDETRKSSVVLIREDENPPAPEVKSGKAKARVAGQTRRSSRERLVDNARLLDQVAAYEQSLQEVVVMNKGIAGKVVTRTNEFGQEVFAGYHSGRLPVKRLQEISSERRSTPVVWRGASSEEREGRGYASAKKKVLKEKFVTIDVTDVSENNKYYPDMVKMMSYGLLKPDKNHQFHPNESVKWTDILYSAIRAQDQDLDSLAKLQKQELPEISNVLLTRTKVSRSIYTAYTMGLVDQDFDKNEEPTRGDALMVLAKTFDLEVNKKSRRSSFQDIELEHDLAPILVAAKRAGWFENFKSKRFNPQQKISRIEFASWFINALEEKRKHSEADKKQSKIRQKVLRGKRRGEDQVRRGRERNYKRLGTQTSEFSDIDRHLLGRQYTDEVAPDPRIKSNSGWTPVRENTARTGPLEIEDRSEYVRKPTVIEKVIRDPEAADQIENLQFLKDISEFSEEALGEIGIDLNSLKQKLFSTPTRMVEEEGEENQEVIETEDNQTTSSEGLVH